MGLFRTFRARGSARDKSDRADDQEDACPTVEREVFMKPEATEQSNDDIAKSSRWHDEGEIGPRERRHVAGKEANQEDDSRDNKRIEKSFPKQAEVVKVDLADLRHAAGEKGVSYGCSEHDGEEDGILRRLKRVLHKKNIAARSPDEDARPVSRVSNGSAEG